MIFWIAISFVVGSLIGKSLVSDQVKQGRVVIEGRIYICRDAGPVLWI